MGAGELRVRRTMKPGAGPILVTLLVAACLAFGPLVAGPVRAQELSILDVRSDNPDPGGSPASAAATGAATGVYTLFVAKLSTGSNAETALVLTDAADDEPGRAFVKKVRRYLVDPARAATPPVRSIVEGRWVRGDAAGAAKSGRSVRPRKAASAGGDSLKADRLTPFDGPPNLLAEEVPPYVVSAGDFFDWQSATIASWGYAPLLVFHSGFKRQTAEAVTIAGLTVIRAVPVGANMALLALDPKSGVIYLVGEGAELAGYPRAGKTLKVVSLAVSLRGVAKLAWARATRSGSENLAGVLGVGETGLGAADDLAPRVIGSGEPLSVGLEEAGGRAVGTGQGQAVVQVAGGEVSIVPGGASTGSTSRAGRTLVETRVPERGLPAGEGAAGEQVAAQLVRRPANALERRLVKEVDEEVKRLVDEFAPIAQTERPFAAAVCKDVRTGKAYRGLSNNNAPRTGEVHATLTDPPPSLHPARTVENCAEWEALNKALLDGARREDLVFSTWSCWFKTPMKACPNCRRTLVGCLVGR